MNVYYSRETNENEILEIQKKKKTIDCFDNCAESNVKRLTSIC